MSQVYLAEGNAFAELQQKILELRGSDKPLIITVRQLGENSVLAARMYIDSILITEDRDPSLAIDEHPRRLATVCIATGRAALEGTAVLHSATLTLHEQETITTPPCELEINDQNDLG